MTPWCLSFSMGSTCVWGRIIIYRMRLAITYLQRTNSSGTYFDIFGSDFRIKCLLFSKENMALCKPVWENQRWQGNESWTGEKAVDCRYKDRSTQGGQCIVSENGAYSATWRVDQGGVVSISHIDIYYRTDNLPRIISILLIHTCFVLDTFLLWSSWITITTT